MPHSQPQNQISASIEFYFKGEKITTSVELDLDSVMQTNQELPNFYPLLASSIKLDIYSYEYEILQTEEILYSHAKGIASDYLHDGLFDFEAFKSSWIMNQVNLELSDIALRHLSIDTLDEQSGLKLALIEAYELGRRDMISQNTNY